MSLPALSPDEFQIAIRTWCEVLENEVPGYDLSRAYIRAARDKQDGFALSAADVVRGFRANCASDRVAPQIPQDSNLLVGDVCSRCHGSGMEVLTDPNDDRYKIAKRCDHVPTEPDDDFPF